jgi:Type IV secretion-system coupling protein DNA-binding domain
MSKEEYYLYKGGYIIGDMIGWLMGKGVDKFIKAKEEREDREMLTPGDPRRTLPTWQVEICERKVRDILTYLPDTVAGAIQQPAQKLCRDILLFEKKHRKSLSGKMDEILWLILWNLLGEKLDNRLIGGKSGEKIFSVPLHTLHSDVAKFIDAFHAIISAKTLPPDGRPCTRLMARFIHNKFAASGIDDKRWEENGKPQPVHAHQMKGKSASELVDSFLADTPFTHFFNTSLPVSIPLASRFEHMHIVGGSGHGKTQLLQSFILHDLHKLREGKRSVIVIDSQGDLIRKIEQLAILEEISDRVVIIDPREIATPPALNLFDFGLDRITNYTPLEQETLLNGAIELYGYMFGALFGAELTQRQGVIFRYVATLMLLVPNATIKTLMDFLQEPERTRPYLSGLNEDSALRRFFETQFFSKSFDDTRQRILTRLWGVVANQTLERMFSNERNKLDLFTAMNRGSLILINTAKDLLKQEGCEILGRFFIALICQAAQERASIPENKRMPTFVYIDEAHDYFDENMEKLFNEVRKYAVGLCIAHQNLDQFEQTLLSTVTASTSIKLVGGLSAKDAAFLSRNMRSEPEMLLNMRKYDNRSEFACYVRNLTPHPIPLTVPFGTMEKEPTLRASALESIKAQNRARYCASLAEHTETKPLPKGTNGHEGLGKHGLL